MSQSEQYYFNWESTGSLGTITLWSVSEKYVKVDTNSNIDLKYNLVSGTLPYGLTLQDNGLITGVATTSTTTLIRKFVTSTSIISSLTSGTNVLTINSTLNSVFNLSLIKVNDFVTATNVGIPLNTYITNITTTSFFLSSSTTATINSGTTIGIFRSTATINTFTFAVSVNKLGEDALTTATFSISVINKKNKTFCELFFQPYLPNDQRSTWHGLINNSKIFDSKNLYRPRDPNFGVQKDIKCVLHYDFELFSLRDFANIITDNFYRRRFTLSKPKIRYAKVANKIVYEVICLDIIDYNTINGTSIPKTVNINGINYYPSSFENMRQQLENFGETNPEIRPTHFQTLQENEIRVDSYLPIVVLCYAQPTKGKTILDRINNEKIDFNKFDFTFNKVLVKNHFTGVVSTVHVEQNPSIT